jgi:hypothetical protein
MSESDHQATLLAIEKVLALLRSVKTLEGTDKDGVEHILQMAVDSLKNWFRPAGKLVAIVFGMANMKTSGTNREREHAERMLKRAQRQQVRAAKLVEKWQTRIANLDRVGVAAIQPRLWLDESDTVNPPTSLSSDA